MLQTHDYVEPDFNLGKNVRCLMLTREFLKEKTRGPSNFLGKVTGKPVQLMEQVHGVKIKTVSNYLDEPLEGCLLYTSPSPRDATLSRMPSSA